jgi:AcrR family transcriptional regulator
MVAMNLVSSPEVPELGRRERKRSETRERIFRCAMRLFAERGFFATTVEDITEAADVGKGTFFNYFPSKEGVFNVLSEIQLGKVAEARTRAERGEAAVHEVLHDLLHRITEEPGHSRALTRSLLSAFCTDAVREITAGTLARGREMLAGIFEVGQARGEIRRDCKAMDLAFVFQQMALGTLLLWSMQPEGSLKPWLHRSFESLWSAVSARKGAVR